MSGAAGNTADPASPSIKSLDLVRNKNNVAELELRRQLEQYNREMSMSIMNLDHDRLDTKDFLRNIKSCTTDDLPESKLWLSRKNKESNERNVVTAPPGGRTKAEDPPEEEEPPEEKEKEEELSDDLLRRLKQSSQITLNIFSRRNQYSTIERKVKRPPLPNMVRKATKPKSEIREVTFDDESTVANSALPTAYADSATGFSDHASGTVSSSNATSRMNTPCVKRNEQRDSAKMAGTVSSSSNDHKNKNGGDFMKELLVRNAKKRYRKNRERLPPLEDRISDFYSRIDTSDSISELTPDERKRQWLQLTGGTKGFISKAKAGDDKESNAT